jgi:hypothetical protein
MKSCVSNKKIYLSRSLAEDALIEARTKFDYAPNSGPITVYQCEDCGFFHLTSKGKMNERLAKHVGEGKIDLQKEANRWLDKLKNRNNK